MDLTELKDALLSRLSENILPLILLLVGIILLGFGVLSLFVPKQSKEVVFEPAKSTGVTKPDQTDSIMVDIEGAVIRPGVYSLSSNARLQDVLIKAGGMTNIADRTKIAHTINLASKLTDGAKIYIPFIGEKAVFGVQDSLSDSESSGIININTASADLLDSLSGVGPVTAQKIITNRPYQSINELITKKAVSAKVFSQIQQKITAE